MWSLLTSVFAILCVGLLVLLLRLWNVLLHILLNCLGSHTRPLGLSAAVVRLDADQAVAQNLPPALAETIPNLPALGDGRSFAVVCSGFACQPPVFDAQELARALGSALSLAAGAFSWTRGWDLAGRSLQRVSTFHGHFSTP